MSGISGLFGGGKRKHVEVVDTVKQQLEAELAREDAEYREAQRLKKKKGARSTIVAGDDQTAINLLKQTLGGE